MNDYTISAQQVSDQRLEYTWTPNPFPAAPNTLWVEYPFDVAQIKGQDVFYPVLPLFLALGFADSRFHLLSRIPNRPGTNDRDAVFQQVLANWLDFIETEAAMNFGGKIYAEADVDGRMIERDVARPAPAATPYPGVALFLGGGAESLLSLAQLTEQQLRPHLISYLGPGWIGSDPVTNESKIGLDQRIAKELGVELHHIHSNMYGLFVQMQSQLQERMVEAAFFVNRVPFTPTLVSLFAPLTSIYSLGTAYHGHEWQPEGDPTFLCFAKSFTDRLASAFSPKFTYRRILWNLSKVDVFERLCTKHPRFLKYQYSCHNNQHERWCCNCEKCFRYYVLYKLFDAPFDAAEFDEPRMLRNFARIRPRIADYIWSEDYAREAYRGILARASARGNKELCELLSNLFRDGKRIGRKKKAMALIRPLVPTPIRRLMKNVFPAPPGGSARV